MLAPMRTAVVGGAGLVGRAMARRDDLDLTVFDRVPPGIPGTRFVPTDVLEGALDLRGFDAVVHLVARVDPPTAGADREAMRRLHVEGTRRVFEAAQRGGVPHAVLFSSAVVYGAGPGRRQPFVEDDPVRPNPGFFYAEDKAAQEEVARGFAQDLAVTVLRPAIIYAPDAKNYLTEFLRRAPGVLPALDGHRPALDFVDVQDVVDAVRAVLQKKCAGTFNIAPRAPIAYDDIARVCGLRVVRVPRRLVRPVLDFGARFVPPWLRAPGYLLDHLMYGFCVDGGALSRATGFVAARSAEQALARMMRTV